jgi:hypothetical protein
MFAYLCSLQNIHISSLHYWVLFPFLQILKIFILGDGEDTIYIISVPDYQKLYILLNKYSVYKNFLSSVIEFVFIPRHHHPEKDLNHSVLDIVLYYVLVQHWAAISAGTQLMVMAVSCVVKPNTTALSARPTSALCHVFKSTMKGNLLQEAERQQELSHLPS